MSYIIIEEFVNIIFGEYESIVNNLKTNKVYEIHETETQILKKIAKGVSTEELYQEFDSEVLDDFINSLNESCCITMSDNFYIKDKRYYGQYKPYIFRDILTIDMLTIELPLSCKKGCEFCGNPTLLG